MEIKIMSLFLIKQNKRLKKYGKINNQLSKLVFVHVVIHMFYKDNAIANCLVNTFTVSMK